MLKKHSGRHATHNNSGSCNIETYVVLSNEEKIKISQVKFTFFKEIAGDLSIRFPIKGIASYTPF